VCSIRVRSALRNTINVGYQLVGLSDLVAEAAVFLLALATGVELPGVAEAAGRD